MAGEHFVEFGGGGFSVDDLYDCAHHDIEGDTPQFFQFLMAVETIRMLRAISRQLDDLQSEMEALRAAQ